MDTCLITIEQLLSSPCSSSHILFSLLSKFLTFAFTLLCFRFAIPPLQIPTLKPGVCLVALRQPRSGSGVDNRAPTQKRSCLRRQPRLVGRHCSSVLVLDVLTTGSSIAPSAEWSSSRRLQTDNLQGDGRC
jgi:hypothetical protein